MRSKNQKQLGQDIYVADPEPWLFDGGFIWLCLIPAVCLKLYLISLGCRLFHAPMRRELGLLFNIFFENIRYTHTLGTMFDMFYHHDIANKISWGSGVTRSKFIYAYTYVVFLNQLNPFSSYIPFIVVYMYLLNLIMD